MSCDCGLRRRCLQDEPDAKPRLVKFTAWKVGQKWSRWHAIDNHKRTVCGISIPKNDKQFVLSDRPENLCSGCQNGN